MGLLDEHDDDPQIVNIFDFYKLHGLADQTVYQLVLHCLLTRSFALEADARAAALFEMMGRRQTGDPASGDDDVEFSCAAVHGL